MGKPDLATLLVLEPKGGSKPRGETSPHKSRIKQALKAAFDAAHERDEDRFIDAMEGALGFSRNDDGDEG